MYKLILFILIWISVCQQNVILDTDIGTDVDDSISILLALSSLQHRLVAITTNGPFPHIGAAMAKKYLSLLGRSDIPVFSGHSKPLRKGDFSKTNYEGIGVVFPWENWKIEKKHAVDAIIEFCKNDDIEVIAVGPMTNIASALEKDPTIVKKIKKFTIMGGSLVKKLSNISLEDSLKYDYNLRIDADAAMKVLTKIENIIMVPGNVTLKCWFTMEDDKILQRIAKEKSEYLEVLLRQIFLWTPIQRKILEGVTEDNVAFLHDPLAVSAAFRDDFLIWKNLSFTFDTNKNGVFHTIVCDENCRNMKSLKTAVDVDCLAFRKFIIQFAENYKYPKRISIYWFEIFKFLVISYNLIVLYYKIILLFIFVMFIILRLFKKKKQIKKD